MQLALLERFARKGADNDRALHLEDFTTELLIEWALQQKNVSEANIIAQVRTHKFAGTEEERDNAAVALTRAFREVSLNKRRMRRSEEQLIVKEAERQQRVDDEAQRAVRDKRNRRRKWLAGEGTIRDRVLEVPQGPRQDQRGEVSFETYDDEGEIQTLKFADVEQQLEAIQKQCRALQDEILQRYKLDRKEASEALSDAAWYQLPGHALLGMGGRSMGFSKPAIAHGVVAVKHAQLALDAARAALSDLAHKRGTPAVEGLNEARHKLLQANHSLHKMLRIRDSDNQDSIHTLGNYSKAGDYAAMVLPPPVQLLFRAGKNAAVRLSNMHSNPNASFGVGGFAKEVTIDYVSNKVQARLAGPKPSFSRSFGSAVATNQVAKVALTNDPSQLTKFNAIELALAAAGGAHSSWAQARALPAGFEPLTPLPDAAPTPVPKLLTEPVVTTHTPGSPPETKVIPPSFGNPHPDFMHPADRMFSSSPPIRQLDDGYQPGVCYIDGTNGPKDDGPVSPESARRAEAQTHDPAPHSEPDVANVDPAAFGAEPIVDPSPGQLRRRKRASTVPGSPGGRRAHEKRLGIERERKDALDKLGEAREIEARVIPDPLHSPHPLVPKVIVSKPQPLPSRLPKTPAHKKLLKRLASGIDRKLRPPRTDFAHPPGLFRRKLFDPDEAHAAYNEAYAGAAGRKVALYHNPYTGEYAVMIGSESHVRPPASNEGWEVIVHSHPGAEVVLAHRLPSPHDMSLTLYPYTATNERVQAFIEFDIPGVGRGRTEYGIDPAHPKEPFYVITHEPGKAPQTRRFASMESFEADHGERTKADKTRFEWRRRRNPSPDLDGDKINLNRPLDLAPPTPFMRPMPETPSDVAADSPKKLPGFEWEGSRDSELEDPSLFHDRLWDALKKVPTSKSDLEKLGLGDIDIPASPLPDSDGFLSGYATIHGNVLHIDDVGLDAPGPEELLGIARQLLKYAESFGVEKVRLTGTIEYTGEAKQDALAAKYGPQFDITVPATKEGLTQVTKLLKKNLDEMKKNLDESGN